VIEEPMKFLDMAVTLPFDLVSDHTTLFF